MTFHFRPAMSTAGNFLIQLLKLRQEPDVIIKEESQIINPVLEHGNSFNSQAKGKSTVLFSVIPYMPEHCRMYKACTKHLKPAGLGADTAPVSSTDDTLDVNFSTGLCKREETWTEPYAGAAAENFMYEVGQYPLEISKGDIGINHKAFHLVEHGGMGDV